MHHIARIISAADIDHNRGHDEMLFPEPRYRATTSVKCNGTSAYRTPALLMPNQNGPFERPTERDRT
jgi:hypothetical protein